MTSRLSPDAAPESSSRSSSSSTWIIIALSGFFTSWATPEVEPAERGQLGRVAHQRPEGLDGLEILQQHHHAHPRSRVLPRGRRDEELLSSRPSGGSTTVRVPRTARGADRASSTNGSSGWAGSSTSWMGTPTARSSGTAQDGLGRPVEEQDLPLRVEEDDPVLQLVDHPLEVSFLAEHRQPVRLQLPAQARELGGQLLELVAACPSPARPPRLAAAQPPDLAGRCAAEGCSDQLREPQGHQPGHGQGQRRPAPGPGEGASIQLPPQERGAKPDPDAPERLVVELQRQRHLVGLPG